MDVMAQPLCVYYFILFSFINLNQTTKIHMKEKETHVRTHTHIYAKISLLPYGFLAN